MCIALFLLELLMIRWVDADGLKRWNSSSRTLSSEPSPKRSHFIVNGGKIGLLCVIYLSLLAAVNAEIALEIPFRRLHLTQ